MIFHIFGNANKLALNSSDDMSQTHSLKGFNNSPFEKAYTNSVYIAT